MNLQTPDSKSGALSVELQARAFRLNSSSPSSLASAPDRPSTSRDSAPAVRLHRRPLLAPLRAPPHRRRSRNKAACTICGRADHHDPLVVPVLVVPVLVVVPVLILVLVANDIAPSVLAVSLGIACLAVPEALVSLGTPAATGPMGMPKPTARPSKSAAMAKRREFSLSYPLDVFSELDACRRGDRTPLQSLS